MGQKVQPTGFRLGIVENWRSRWYAKKRDFGLYLVQDQLIRKHIMGQFEFAGIPKIEIERNVDKINLKLHTARPGLVIGRKGQKVDKLRDELSSLTGQEVKIEIVEVKRPELNATLVAEDIAVQLQKRSTGFRRTIKKSLEKTMGAGAKGCKIMIAGRLGGSEMSRTESIHEGSIPLQTLKAKIDYGFRIARTSMGVIGVKCWVYTGEQDERR